MEPKQFLQFLNIKPDDLSLPASERNIYRTLYTALTILPILSFFITLGFVTIYLLGRLGFLDKNEPKLLVVALIALIAALLHLPLFFLMKNKRLENVAIFLVLINSTAAMLQVFLWQGIVWFPIIVTVIPFLIFAIQNGIKRSLRIGAIATALVCSVIIFLIDKTLPFQRMSVENSLAQTAALAIYLMVVTAMAVLILMNSQISFRTISSRLATIFTFIALLSSITTLIIAALANLFYDRQKIFVELDAASKVRADQVGLAIDNLERDVNKTFSDQIINQFVQTMFNTSPESVQYQDAFERVRPFMIREQEQNSRYQEVLLIDSSGKTIFSTLNANNGYNFSGYTFFQNMNIGINFSVESNFPGSYDNSSIILVKPFFSSGHLQGSFVVRMNFDPIKSVLSANTGIGYTAETYLVGLANGHMIPLSNTRQSVEIINTKPAEQALMFQSNGGSGIWDNYYGASVLGSYIRIPSLKAVLISEIEQSEVTQKTINITLTNAIIGLFTILLAFTIVVLTSRSIALPIVDLADKAAFLAGGQLDTRIQFDRKDEIGTLATSFNSMASDLQSLFRTLEDKVEERTRELRKQSNYLRIAAEVARDATTSQSLAELLNHAAQLILDRFNFYHTGIFLIDEQNDYAILRASPTEAGMEMLARNHRLKIGQVGIVGNVAATGLPRIALDTGRDSAFFNNPSLPNTRSEMALPLKVNNVLIGVLDVQSEQPDAFTQDDIGILQIMADQLALAIERVQLAQAQAENLHQLETAYQQFTFNTWNKLTQRSDFKLGYSFDGMNLIPLNSLPSSIRETLAKGRSAIIPDNKLDVQASTLAVPIKLREQVIGVMTILFNSQTISPEAVTLAEETAELLATALENARLYTDTQKVADREKLVSQITSRIRSTNDPKEMIQIALSELKQNLHVTDARILPFTPPNKPEKS